MFKYKFYIVNRDKWLIESRKKLKPIPPARHGTCRIKSYTIFGPYVLIVMKTKK